ncbi:MAG TPA: hypothetical protein QF509_02490 [Rhodospirillales bacterium]|jgi:hypothetical protein|nr:hypothetical protein [Rhodospirillales bacterium]
MLEITLATAIALFVAMEAAVAGLVFWFRSHCKWLITGRDLSPVIDEEGLKRFVEHGWDRELGWVRKPDTDKKEVGSHGQSVHYHIDAMGARRNPGFETLPPEMLIYGDSYAFCRQVENDQTWPHHLSAALGVNAANFGVGNYGLDQAVLRLEREFDDHRAKLVVMAVVPETICRILSVWRHFSEYGNVLAVKPRFVLRNGDLCLLSNPMDDPNKFRRLADFFETFRRNDFFYDRKFSRDLLRFPYSWRFFGNWSRNVRLVRAVLADRIAGSNDRTLAAVMERNIALTAKIYAEKEPLDLLIALCRRFAEFVRNRGAVPMLVFLPQLMDLKYIQAHGHYYAPVMETLREVLAVVDLAPDLLRNDDFASLYINDQYGGHFSEQGNRAVAGLLKDHCGEILRDGALGFG